MTQTNVNLTQPTLLLFALLCSACSEQPAPASGEMDTVPVTVMELQETSFNDLNRRTGSVGLYREEQVGFEVAGRVVAVLDEGLEVQGPAYDEDDTIVERGDVIATLEPTRYRLQVGVLEAQLLAANSQVEAVEATLRLAEQTLDREGNILAEGAGTQQAVDNAQSRFDGATAELEAAVANVTAVEEQVDRALEDFADTTLLAPFSGRITAVHLSQGAVVEVGTPVVTLTLMDPVQVQVRVSADDERLIRTGDRALVFPKDPLLDGDPTPVSAIVYEKSAVADPRTRTFRIDLIVRNERRRAEQLDQRLQGFPSVNEYLPVVRRYQGEDGPLFVPTDSILRDGNSTYVFRLPGVRLGSGDGRSAVGLHTPELIEVEVGEEYMTVIRWNFRSVRTTGLREGDFLILQPQPSYANGVAVGRSQWLFRPGDLVPTEFSIGGAPLGHYVPIVSVVSAGGGHQVAIVEGDHARMVTVDVHETYEELRRITGDAIRDGVRVIVGGVHYVSDGQPISIAGSWNPLQ